MISNALMTISAVRVDPDDIEILFTHSLPENESELAQTANLLKDIVPAEKLIKLLPFIPDEE